MACPRNESGDYAVFLAAYTRSFGDDIRFGFACIKAAPLACSAPVVIARRFFFRKFRSGIDFFYPDML